MFTHTRREFLRLTGGCAALVGVGSSAAATLSSAAAATSRGEAGATDVEIALTATRGQVAILAGERTAIWMYRADLVKGNAASLQTLPGSYLGPIIRVPKGTRVCVRFSNNLPEPSTIHWHGLLVPDRMDGHP